MKKMSILMCSVMATAILTGCSTIDGNKASISDDENSSSLESVDSLSANNSDNSTYITDSQGDNSSLEHIESYTITSLTEAVTSIPATTTIVSTTPPVTASSNTSYVPEQTTTTTTTEQSKTTSITETKPTEDITSQTKPLDTDIQLSADEKEVIELVNLERSKNGLQPLTATFEISAISKIRVKELVELFSDEHTRPDGRGFDTILGDYNIKYSAVGENIAKVCLTPDEVMNEWLNSPSQRENILNSSYQNIGVARYEYEEEVYWVQFFYAP